MNRLPGMFQAFLVIKDQLVRDGEKSVLHVVIHFIIGSSPNFKSFWKTAFGASRKPPYHEKNVRTAPQLNIR